MFPEMNNAPPELSDEQFINVLELIDTSMI